MPEQLTNDATCTLAANCLLNDTQVTINPPIAGSPPFPSSGTFRIKVGTELMAVTSVNGSLWQVNRGDGGSIQAPHNAGDTVEQVLTREALAAMMVRLDLPNTGTLAMQGFQASGIGVFTTPGRFLGIFAAPGPPGAGTTYTTGDWGFDTAGVMWFCSVGGNPGTWIAVNGAQRFHCRGTIAGAWTIASAAITVIPFDTIDSGGDPNSNFNTTTHVYTVPLSGTYRLSAAIQSSALASANPYGRLSVFRNGAEISHGADSSAVNGNLWGASISTEVGLSTGDAVDFRYFQNGVSLTGAVNTPRFAISFVRS